MFGQMEMIPYIGAKWMHTNLWYSCPSILQPFILRPPSSWLPKDHLIWSKCVDFVYYWTFIFRPHACQNHIFKVKWSLWLQEPPFTVLFIMRPISRRIADLGPYCRTEVTAATRCVAPPTLLAAVRSSFMWISACCRVVPLCHRDRAADRNLSQDT